MKPAIGEKIEDFELGSHKGDRHRLTEELKNGPVVLAFFPLAFTGVCTAEMCEFRDTLHDFEGLNATVFGISVDSPHALRVFAEQQNLNFALLSDFNKEVGQVFGVLYEDFHGMRGVTKRSVFVIRPDRSLAYAWVTDNAGERPNLSEVRESLAAL